ncbi:sugar ABC transporter permease [Caldibacillus lycopersici]|uniref:Sugar ABC transporter permease n=1 Tax=Perspicuibacillus lycopersici TaxID=1325689 RepID=A0AAE3LM82_9BACI|nr:sugar ABC transporter permease [Perspicuibacillus lycopersici]MCU9613285.1 sugar ABC transporter permease [Perspicuibacillus lycopersici]
MGMWIERHLKFIFLFPSIIFVLLMIAYPIGYTFYLSFFEWSMSSLQPPEWVFFDNFKALLFDDPRFWPAFFRTFYFTALALVFQTVLGVAIAILFNRKFRGNQLVKTLFLLPMVATPVAVGLVWLLIFEPSIGFANQFLNSLGINPQLWIASPEQALPSIALVDTWQWTPMITLITLAGLSSIPSEYYEAAAVDGANSWQNFWKVTFPLLLPTIFSAVLLRVIDAIKQFDLIYAMTRGGPGFSTETLNIYGFVNGFQYFKLGYTSAILVLFFMIVLGISSIIMILRKKTEVTL